MRCFHQFRASRRIVAFSLLPWTAILVGATHDASGQVVTTADDKISSVANSAKRKKHAFPGAKKVELKTQIVKPRNGKLTLRVQLKLPQDVKINPTAPMGFLLETVGATGPIDRTSPSKYQLVKPPKPVFDLVVPVVGSGDEKLRLSMNYYHCQGDPQTGVCKTGSVVWEIPLKIETTASAVKVNVPYAVPL